MKVTLQNVLPADIERRSMELISQELTARGIALDPINAPIIKRAIHSTADFDYAENLLFSPCAVERGRAALRAGACIVTDTNMALSGINKPALARFGCEAVCFMADPETARAAEAQGVTRAAVSMDRAAMLKKPLIFAVGNAPTALVRLYELIMEGRLSPALIVGVPVGFVNVVESKELLLKLPTPHIVARGRKGGSNVAAAIINALLYGM